MNLNHAVVHELQKDPGVTSATTNLATTGLNVGDPVVVDLVRQIAELIGQRLNAAIYGVFGQGGTQVPNQVTAYCAPRAATAGTFLSLSNNIMATLRTMAQSQSLATGGYIVFADYEQGTNQRFLLVAMIKQRSGITMDGLVPQSITELDLSKLHQVARVSFNRLQQYNQETDPAIRQEITYVTFVSPARNQTAAGYFVTALGCERGTPSAKATNAAIQGFVAFFDTQEAIRPHKHNAKIRLLGLMQEKQAADERITLSDIDTIAREYFPSDDADRFEDLSNELARYLQGEPYEVPFEFAVAKTTLNRHVRFIHQGERLKVEIDKDAISRDDADPIYFDAARRRLVISEESLIDHLSRSLSDDD